MNASDRMSLALIELTDLGRRPPCGAATGDHNDWTSDSQDDRTRAALACRPCPLVQLCGDYAELIKASHGVWAGVDLTKTTRRATA